jgi:hypothetical protein
MPKKPIDYSKCCIYKIEHIENENLIYVGHTTDFNKRKSRHKSNCKNENSKVFNYKLYLMIRDNGGFDMFKMIEIEKYPCNDKREAEKRENEIMKELNTSMNTNQSYLTEEEKIKKIKEKGRKYRENNKEKIVEYNKIYKKQYYQDNQGRIKDKVKHYQETNKVKINCLCGSEVYKSSLKSHQASKNHLNLMNKIKEKK